MILALGIVAVLSNASAVERMAALARGIREREREQELAARAAKRERELNEDEAKDSVRGHL
jgi:hypothetical protein